MANNPTVCTIFSLVDGATGMVDMLTSTIPSCSLRVEIQYDSTPVSSASTLVGLVDGFGGIYDPAVAYPYNQPVPLAYSADGEHPCTSVAWGLTYTSYSLSSLSPANGQTLTIQYDKTISQPPWSSLRIINGSGEDCQVRIYVENY
jgi:hypothetical protein